MSARKLIPLIAGVAACGITAIPLPGEPWRHRGPDGAEPGRETGTTSSTDSGTAQDTAISTAGSGATSTGTQGTSTAGATDTAATGSSTSTSSGSSSSTATATSTIVDTDTSTEFKAETAWARWRMPNPKDAKDPVTNANLPNQASYEYTADSVTVRDTVTGLEWQRTPEARSFNWSDAQQYCAHLSLGGNADWRLPSRIELISLIDYTRTTPPMIDTAAFPSSPFSNYYWSSSVAQGTGDQTVAWGLYGTTVSSLAMSQSYFVRCVR